jgi:hypothetical protein
LDAIDARREHTVRAWEDAEARAEAAVRDRDALAAELAAARQTASADPQYEQRLEAAAEQIRALELQLFGRDRGSPERDVELQALLDSPARRSDHAMRRARRHRFPSSTEVQIDGDAGVLVDLSVGGAQVFCGVEPEVNRVVSLSLPAADTPVTRQGRIVWAWLEPHSKGRPLRYRAGIAFIAPDDGAVQAFIARHAAS